MSAATSRASLQQLPSESIALRDCADTGSGRAFVDLSASNELAKGRTRPPSVPAPSALPRA
eukprot:30612-Pelagococcus_subviridis.AAC.30